MLTKEKVDLIRKLQGRKLALAMQALNSLAEFLGAKDAWEDIKHRYGLKIREEQKVIDPFEREDISRMLSWYREALSRVTEDARNTLLYMLLTGLRPVEAMNSIQAVRESWKEYIRRMDGFLVLQHFKYPDVFLRRTKKAYISVIAEEDLKLTDNAVLSYSTLREKLKEKGMNCRAGYGRKIYSTWLRDHGIEAEFIDLLQGRVGLTVFSRYYYRPDIQEKLRKTLEILTELKKEATSTE